MTKRRSLAGGLFGMPQAIIEAALGELSPDQRAAITASKAQRIMQVAVNTAGSIGAILEDVPCAGQGKNPNAIPGVR